MQISLSMQKDENLWQSRGKKEVSECLKKNTSQFLFVEILTGNSPTAEQH